MFMTERREVGRVGGCCGVVLCRVVVCDFGSFYVDALRCAKF
jgi:hypothetical protein